MQIKSLIINENNPFYGIAFSMHPLDAQKQPDPTAQTPSFTLARLPSVLLA